MRFRFTSIIAALFLFDATTAATNAVGGGFVVGDDREAKEFWSRLLQDTTDSLSLPTSLHPTTNSQNFKPSLAPAKAAVPSDPPTPSGLQTVLPSDSPSSAALCRAEAVVDCTVLDGEHTGKHCREISGEQFPRCTGSRPTELCFAYTAAPCGESVSGLVECRDLNDGGPLGTAEILVTDGSDILLRHAITTAMGPEFCIENGGNPLPETIFINFNSAVTNDSYTANQILQFDVSCDGAGLTLMDSFGAVDLIQFKNDNGMSDCSIQVQYDYLVTNTGSVDLTITELDRNFNGDHHDLITNEHDSSNLVVEPLGVYSATETVTVKRCIDSQYSTSLILVAKTAGGSVCADASGLAFDVATGAPFPSEEQSPSSSPTPSPSPTDVPFSNPSNLPTSAPSTQPSYLPTRLPSDPPSAAPRNIPTVERSAVPSPSLSNRPSAISSAAPSASSSNSPTSLPSMTPSDTPSAPPSINPSPSPSNVPFSTPSVLPTLVSSSSPSISPLVQRSAIPLPISSERPTDVTSETPSALPPSHPSDLPTSLPSAIPTATPSGIPSNEPSPFPSEALSSIPTVAPTIPPSTNPSNDPSMQRSAVPSPVPFGHPTMIASDAPTSLPSLTPTTFPTSVPSKAPSKSSSASPSKLPSLIPSNPPSTSSSNVPSFRPTVSVALAPTDVPTRVLTPTPSTLSSFIPPSDICFVNIEIGCAPSDGSAEDCASIQPRLTLCEDRPFAMSFRYNGGDCSQSFNIQTASLFQCKDFQGGPPTSEGDRSFITVVDIKGLGIIYHANFVAVGDNFPVANSNGNEVQANMNVTVYSSGTTVPENILQTMIYHSSCSRNLFLKDRFGSVQLVAFENDLQGLVSCFHNITYTFTVENVAAGGNAIMQTLVSITNQGSMNLTDQVNGVVVAPSSSITFNQIVQLDISVRQQYTAFTTLTGLSPENYACQDTAFFSFIAGSPLPPSIPTDSPTPLPTKSSAPTPDPEGYPCSLRAHVYCDIIEEVGDSSTTTDCASLSAPTETTCSGNSSPISLSFVYTGEGSCPGNNDARGFRCEENNGGGDDEQKVYVEVRGDPTDDEVFFEGVVSVGEVFTANGVYGREADITISTVNSVSNSEGRRLQTMRLRTRCQNRDDLTLLNSFGGLRLVGFVNVVTGSQQVFRTIRIQYKVENEGPHQATITNAVGGAVVEGAIMAASIDDSGIHGQIVAVRDQVVVGEETLQINVMEDAGVSLAFFMMVQGTTLTGGGACDDRDNLSFAVL